MELLVDGVLLELQSPSRTSTSVYGGKIRETQMYPIQEEDLRKLASAREVKVRVPGGKYSVKGRFSDDNFKVLRGFVAQYVGTGGTEGHARTDGGGTESHGQAAGAPMPTQQPSAALVDAVPTGTNWIADGRTRTYYRVGCPESAKIPAADRLYYGSETSLKAAGFKPADKC
jgi:hypothetical protein